MLDEYDCWLQKRALTTFPIAFDRVFAESDGGETAEQAIREFCRGVERLSGIKPKILNHEPPQTNTNIKEDTGAEARVAHLVCGKKQDFKSVSEGFSIKAGEKEVIITGQDGTGLLYGVFRFLILLSLGEINNNFELSDAPVSPLRMINHWDNLDGAVERGYAGASLFFRGGRFDYDEQRIEDYARLLASVGINRISINNVNVRAEAKLLISKEYLADAAAFAAIFRRFGIRIFISVNFGSPLLLGKLATSDPLDPAVIAWWKERAALVYKYIPDLAGFIVKADSEGEAGPFQYKRTHADGANMLAQALKPYGGDIIWRCFVYNCTQDWRDRSIDRARASYDHFKPLDGAFNDNVILQIKSGPYDFQVCEPVSPLFGAMQKTRHVMELQITQEYTGQQIDLCYLPLMWEDIMYFDTACGPKSRIGELVGPYVDGRSSIEGFAAVANTGMDRNWTGHTLAQANLYGYGRMAWNPRLKAAEIAREWSVLSFGSCSAAETAAAMLLKSYPAYAQYTAPFGVCFMVTPNTHYGPNIEGYEYSRWGTYHRADAHAIGIDRTPAGTAYTGQYSAHNAALFADPASCPENLLLFFHRLPYDYIMKNGRTLLQNIYDTHFKGYEEAASMLEMWKGLKNQLEDDIYSSVLSRLELQLSNAREWRDQINTYFYRKTGIGDKQGRIIYR